MTVLEPSEKEQCPNCGSSDTYYEVGFLICRTCSHGCKTPTSILNYKKQSLREKKGELVGILRVVLLIPVPLVISALLIYTILFARVGKNASIILAILSVAMIITTLIAIRLHSKRCKKCGKWKALEEIKAEVVQRQEVIRTGIQKEYHRDKRGELIKTVEKEVPVPGVNVVYKITKKCKFCGRVSYDYRTRHL